MVIDPKSNSSETPLKESILKGLQNCFFCAAQNNIETLYLPLLLLETGKEEMISSQSESVIQRMQQIFTCIKEFLDPFPNNLSSYPTQGLQSFHFMFPTIRNLLPLSDATKSLFKKTFPSIVGK